MNTIIFVCIFGIVLSPQAEGCNPYADTKGVVDQGEVAIAHLYNHITQVKLDFTMKVIQMKMDQTTRIYSIMADAFKPVLMRARHKRTDMPNDCISWYWDLQKASIAAAAQLKKCVKTTSNVFRPIEKNIEEFLDDRTHCLLNLDDVRTRFCRNSDTKYWEECVAAASLTEVSSSLLTCDYEEYNIKLRELESNASLLSESGKSDTSRCLEEVVGKYHDTIKPIKDFAIQCSEIYA